MRAVREKRLVFIDESFCKTGMCREFGWGFRGERVRGTRPFRSWKTVALIGAIRLGAEPKLMTPPGSFVVEWWSSASLQARRRAMR